MKIKKIIMWILTGFFAVTALSFMPSFTSFVAIAAAVLLAPIPKWQELIGRYIRGGLKTIVVIVMTIVIALSAPDTEAEDKANRRDDKNTVETTAATSQPTMTDAVDDTVEGETEPSPVVTTPPETEPAPVVTTPPETEPAPVVTTPPETEPAPVVTTPPETEPVPVVTTPPATEVPSEQMVWITATGSRYHSIPNCGNTKSSSCVPISQAENMNLTACNKCY